MKKLFLFGIILVLFALPPAVAQTDPWPHLGVGFTTNFWNGEPPKTLWDRLRLEFSPVFQVGSSPNVYVLPSLDYATANGLVRLGSNLFVHVFRWGSWDFYTGGGVSPLQLSTNKEVKVNSQASLAFDFGATRKVYKWTGANGQEKTLRLGFELQHEVSGQIGTIAPETKSPDRITTAKVGFIF